MATGRRRRPDPDRRRDGDHDRGVVPRGYEERARRGDRWPGIFDPRTVAPPDWKDRLPPLVHLFEKDVLRRCAAEAGFTVETSDYFCFRKFPARYRTDGREYVTFTARKPGA